MAHLLLLADRVLREDSAAALCPGTARSLRQLVGLIVVCGTFYGAVMGTFGGVAGERAWQVVFSASKVPLLLLVTFLIALPSFFVLNTLLGLRADFPEVLRALVGSQAGLAVVLAGLAPYTALWYVSAAGYPEAILVNGIMFALASLAAQVLLRRYYLPLAARNRRHLWLLRTWIVLYVFVGIQLGWVLRPFVGSPGMPVQFFRADSWGNAYVIVLQMLWNLVTR